MTTDLPIKNVILSRRRGAFKPCRWCAGAVGRIEAVPTILPANHAGKMICEGCGRQTAWLSARQIRNIPHSSASPSRQTDKPGVVFLDAPGTNRADGGADIVMQHSNIAGAS